MTNRAIFSRFLLTTLPSFGLGCGAPYRPVAPHQSATEDLRGEVVSIDTLPPLTVELRVNGTSTAKIRRALLAPAAAEACREGVRAQSIDLDEHRKWLRPIEVEGAHALRLTFSAGAARDLLTAPTAIDLVLASAQGPDRCLRVPLTGTEPLLAFTTERHGYASSALRTHLPVKSVAGVGAGWSYSIGFGAYAGPVRLGADAGLGTAACTHTCEGSSAGFLWLPVGVTASAFLIDRRNFAVQLGAGYRFYFADVGSSDARRSLTISAPEVRLSFASTAWQGPGLPSGARIAAASFDLFASDWRFRGPAGLESSFVAGLGLSWQLGW